MRFKHSLAAIDARSAKIRVSTCLRPISTYFAPSRSAKGIVDGGILTRVKVVAALYEDDRKEQTRDKAEIARNADREAKRLADTGARAEFGGALGQETDRSRGQRWPAVLTVGERVVGAAARWPQLHGLKPHVQADRDQHQGLCRLQPPLLTVEPGLHHPRMGGRQRYVRRLPITCKTQSRGRSGEGYS